MTDDPEAPNGWKMITIEELRAELAKAHAEIAELRAVAGAARQSKAWAEIRGKDR